MEKLKLDAINILTECGHLIGKNKNQIRSKVDIDCLTEKAKMSVKEESDPGKLETIMTGFSGIVRGLNTLYKANSTQDTKDMVAGYIDVTIGAGRIICLVAMPAVLPLFSMASAGMAYVKNENTSMTEVVKEVVEAALDRFDDKKFLQKMAGVQNEFDNYLAYINGAEDIKAQDVITVGAQFLGKVEGKITELKRQTTTNTGTEAETAGKILKYIEMYCQVAATRLSVLQQIYANSVVKEKRDSEGILNTINKQRKKLVSLFQCITNPEEDDAVILAAFFPSKQPILLAAMSSLGLKYEDLTYLRSYHYLKTGNGRFACDASDKDGGSTSMVKRGRFDKLATDLINRAGDVFTKNPLMTVSKNKLESKRENSKRENETTENWKFDFEPVGESGDNVFRIKSDRGLYVKIGTKHREKVRVGKGESDKAKIKIVKVNDESYLLCSISSLGWFCYEDEPDSTSKQHNVCVGKGVEGQDIHGENEYSKTRDVRLTELKEVLLKRQYPKSLIDGGIIKAKAIPMKELRTPNTIEKSNVIPYVSTYNQRNSEAFEIIHNNLQILSQDQKMKIILEKTINQRKIYHNK